MISFILFTNRSIQLYPVRTELRHHKIRFIPLQCGEEYDFPSLPFPFAKNNAPSHIAKSCAIANRRSCRSCSIRKRVSIRRRKFRVSFTTEQTKKKQGAEERTRTIPVSEVRCCDWKKTASISLQSGHCLFDRGSCSGAIHRISNSDTKSCTREEKAEAEVLGAGAKKQRHKNAHALLSFSPLNSLVQRLFLAWPPLLTLLLVVGHTPRLICVLSRRPA